MSSSPVAGVQGQDRWCSSQKAARIIAGAKNTKAFVLVNGKGAAASSRLDFMLTALNTTHRARAEVQTLDES